MTSSADSLTDKLVAFIRRCCVDDTLGSGRQHAVVLATLWLVCFLALLALRPGFPFPPYGLLDSWIYTSYQWDLRNQIADFGPTYYGSRLSWILPGAILQSIVPPVAAEISFKGFMSAMLAAAAGFTGYRTVGFRWSLLLVAVVTLNPQLIVGFHADYIDTPVIVFAAVALALNVAARESHRWPIVIFLAGAAFACMVSANLSSISTVGFGLVIFHFVWLRWNFLRHLLSLLFYLAGFASVVLIIGLAHLWVGGSFNFLQAQIDMALYMKGLATNPWMPTDPLWFMGATWLITPAVALLWGGYHSTISPPANIRLRQLIRALTGALLASLLVGCIWEICSVAAVMSLYYYASFHLTFALPLLISCCAASAPTTAPRWPRLFAGLALTFSLGLAGFPLNSWAALGRIMHFLPRPEALPLAVAGLLLVILGLLAAHLKRRALLVPEILVTGTVLCSMPSGYGLPALSDHLRERYASVHTAYQTIAREFPPGSFVYWVDAKQPDGISLASTKLWGYRLFSLKLFPEFDPQDIKTRTVIIPCLPGKGAEALNRAFHALARSDVDLGDEKIIPIRVGAGVGFDLASFSMKTRPFDPEHSPSTPDGKSNTVVMHYLYAGDVPYTRWLGSAIHRPGPEPVLDFTKGYPVFTRTDPRDHLATQYVDLPAATPGQHRQLSAVFEMPAAGDCLCAIQDENFREYQKLRLTEAGRTVHSINIPPEAKRLRWYFMADGQASTPLPIRLTVFELHPQQSSATSSVPKP